MCFDCYSKLSNASALFDKKFYFFNADGVLRNTKPEEKSNGEKEHEKVMEKEKASVCVFVCLSFCLFVFLSVCLFVCLTD